MKNTASPPREAPAKPFTMRHRRAPYTRNGTMMVTNLSNQYSGRLLYGSRMTKYPESTKNMGSHTYASRDR